jgi:hypothetical protein
MGGTFYTFISHDEIIFMVLLVSRLKVDTTEEICYTFVGKYMNTKYS